MEVWFFEDILILLKVGSGSDIMTKERKSKKENIKNFRILQLLTEWLNEKTLLT